MGQCRFASSACSSSATLFGLPGASAVPMHDCTNHATVKHSPSAAFRAGNGAWSPAPSPSACCRPTGAAGWDCAVPELCPAAGADSEARLPGRGGAAAPSPAPSAALQPWLLAARLKAGGTAPAASAGAELESMWSLCRTAGDRRSMLSMWGDVSMNRIASSHFHCSNLATAATA